MAKYSRDHMIWYKRVFHMHYAFLNGERDKAIDRLERRYGISFEVQFRDVVPLIDYSVRNYGYARNPALLHTIAYVCQALEMEAKNANS